MIKQFVIIGIIVLFCSVELSGCEEQNITQIDKEKFIGTWYGNQVSVCCGSQNKTIIFEKTGSSSGSFNFVANVDGNYLVKIIYTQYVSGKSNIPVTLQAKQTSMTTFI